MSPLRVVPSGRRFLDPPNRRQAMAFLMSAGVYVAVNDRTHHINRYTVEAIGT